jgi:hypothetical protein
MVKHMTDEKCKPTDCPCKCQGFGELSPVDNPCTYSMCLNEQRMAEFSFIVQVLFTVVSREEKYSAKLVIDTVVQRCGDVIAAAVFQVLGEGVWGYFRVFVYGC